MATYSKPGFSSSNYIQFRPTYPAEFYQALVAYHRGPLKTAVDVGSGPGEASFALAEYVEEHVIAVDPSPVMVQKGREVLEKEPKEIQDKVEFAIAPAESLANVLPNDCQADLVTAAECFHWTDAGKFFPNVAKILRPGGTLGIWMYKDPVFVDHPEADELYNKYTYDDPRFIGPHWEQPGRRILKEYYPTAQPPPELFQDVQKVYYKPEEGQRTPTALHIYKNATVKDIYQYVISWSGYHTWKEAHPNEPDVAELFIGELKEKLGWTDETVFRVEWATFYCFARRK